MRPTYRTAARPLVEELETRLTPAQVGANDFRLSDMGPDGDGNFSARDAAIAYNPTNNEYLVVWSGDDNAGGLADEEEEIFAQRVNAATGARVGGRIRVSDMGPNGNANFDANQPAVAYNPVANEYLVVWSGEDDTAPLADNEFEIFGQRLNAATGAEVGPNDFRISDMGGSGDSAYDAGSPAVAYNSVNHEYLVVWQANDDQPGLSKFAREIWGQRLDAAGGQLGLNDFRISDMGPDGSDGYEAKQPAVAYNPTANEYLVVWEGDDDTAPLTDNEFEIFGQRLLGVSGAETGANDFRVSDMGPDGSAVNYAETPAVAYNPTANEYLVAWSGTDTADDEVEIWGQRLSATGAEAGANDFRVSDMGPNGGDDFAAFQPAVAYNPAADEYLVVWQGDDNATADGGESEHEVYAQRLSAGGAEVGPNDFQVSDVGLAGDDDSDVEAPAVAFNAVNREYLVVWHGDDNTSAATDADELEIYGQRLTGAPTPAGPTTPAATDLQARVLRRKGVSVVQAFDAATGAERFRIVPFGRRFKGQVKVLTADLTGDSHADLIVFQGRGGKGLVQVYDGLTGQRKLQTKVGRGAVTAAFAEVTGDNLIDLIVKMAPGRAKKQFAKVIRGGDLAVLASSV